MTDKQKAAREVLARLDHNLMLAHEDRNTTVSLSIDDAAFLLAFADQQTTTLQVENERLRAERLKLDRRIHNQRLALRENWEIVHQRFWWIKKLPLQSRLLAHCLKLHREIATLRTALQDQG